MRLDHSEIKVADLKKFAEEWSKYDPDATMLVKTRYFVNLLTALKPPLGVARRGDRTALLATAVQLNIPEHGGEIHFVETLIPLARNVQNVAFTERDLRDHEDGWKENFDQLSELPVLRYRQKRVGVEHYLASTFIASAYRRSIAQREFLRDLRLHIKTVDDTYERQGVPPEQREAVIRLKKKFDARHIPSRFAQYVLSFEGESKRPRRPGDASTPQPHGGQASLADLLKDDA
jgi:hypothetical protein